MSRAEALLAEGEQHFLIPSPIPGLRLFLRQLSPSRRGASDFPVVLFVHGATFASGMAIAHRFDGIAWRDALCAAGFSVWALDLLGFGASDRYPEMNASADDQGPLCLAREAAGQVEAAARFILEREQVTRLSFIAHSWGSMPVGLFAAAHPNLVGRIVLFAPLACRMGPRYVPRPSAPAFRIVTIEDQWRRFVEDVPPGEPAVLSQRHFDEWAERYLDSDPDSRTRNPHGVKVPTGPIVEILRAWHGELAWEPEKVTAPVAIIRGGWDGLVTDADAKWLLTQLQRSSEKRDIKIERGTHLMHLEEMRFALWTESANFLLGNRYLTPEGDSLMQDHHDDKDIPGYNLGSPEVAGSPISLEELNDLKASCLFTDEDVIYLRLSYDVLKEQAEDLVTMWRGIIAHHPHLTHYSQDVDTGKPDKEYGARVGKRFAQWVLDTARADYDQAWLDYQYEIGLRHHRAKKNKTDGAHTAGHIRGRDLIGFAAATVAPMRPYLEKGGHSEQVVNRMLEAWWKSMILQVTLWSQPYMNPGDF